MMTTAERVQILIEEIEALDDRAQQAQKEKEWAQRLAAQKRLALVEIQDQKHAPRHETIIRELQEEIGKTMGWRSR